MEMQGKIHQKLISSISKDCANILDAIRRLRDGTWRLDHEDADWACHLLPQIREALQDHIEYESQCVFPGLSDAEAKEHSEEHEKIMALLWAAEFCRLNKESVRFHVFLDLLIKVLDEHHEKFGCHLPDAGQSLDQCCTAKIIRRAKGSSLENL